MMRIFFFSLFFFVLASFLGAAYFAFEKNPEKNPVVEKQKNEETGSVQGASDKKKKPDIPVLEENHSFATIFRPEKKPYALNLAVTTAHAAIILDADSGSILYDRNGNERRQVASLTKMFTTLIVVERVKNLDELVTIGDEIYIEGTRVGCPRSGFCNGERLKVGEKISVRNLLYAALMNSANDAATALGKHVGGSIEGFANIMNERAKSLGLENSHFCTPSGLEPEGRESECYSSAKDMATITAAALKYQILWEMMRTERKIISSADGTYEHEIFNTNELLGQFPNLLGTKTGFTPLAGRSLLAAATDESGEHRVIAVVLDDLYRWESIRSMFKWSFSSFDWR